VGVHEQIAEFLRAGPFAVVGASADREKYGNKVLRAYLQQHLPVHCVHPRERSIEGVTCDRTLAELAARVPGGIRAVSIITPPGVTEDIVEQAARLGIHHLWMQPGSESPRALERARTLGLDVIAGGPCLLVALRFRDA
jgi:predicted CoA-binding protein